MKEHNILRLLDKGLCVTVNSDDPAYFGGYLNENFYAISEHLGANKTQIEKLIKNSFKAAFLSQVQRGFHGIEWIFSFYISFRFDSIGSLWKL